MQNIFEEHKRTGVPLATLMQKLNASVNTTISPGNGVPEISKRNPRKKKGK